MRKKVINNMTCSRVLLLYVVGNVNWLPESQLKLCTRYNPALSCLQLGTQSLRAKFRRVTQMCNFSASRILTCLQLHYELWQMKGQADIGLEQKIQPWCISHWKKSLANNVRPHSGRYLRMFSRDLTDKSWWVLLWQIKYLLLPDAHPHLARDYYPTAVSRE